MTFVDPPYSSIRNTVAFFLSTMKTNKKENQKKEILPTQNHGEKQTDRKHFRFWYFPGLHFFTNFFLLFSLSPSPV